MTRHPILFPFLMACMFLAQGTPVSGQETVSVRWRTDYNVARKEAQDKNLPLLIDFVTQNCFWCKELERKTFVDPRVVALLAEKVVPLKVDAERDTNLASFLRISSYPTIVIASPDGKLLGTIVGFEEAGKFQDSVQQALAKVEAPDWMERDLRLASKWIGAGDYARAISTLKTIVEDGKGRPVQGEAKNLLVSLEKKAEDRLAKAKELHAGGQNTEAITSLAETMRLFPGLQAARQAGELLTKVAAGADERRQQRESRARKLLSQAKEFHKNKEYICCLDRCEILIEGFGDLAEGQEAALLIGDIKSNPEWLQGAADALSERLGSVYLALADSLLKRGQPQRAEFYLQRLIQAFPGSRQAESAQIRLGQLQGTPARNAQIQSARP